MDIDLYVGGAFENEKSEFIIGPTFSCITNEQFQRYRIGDPYFYDNPNGLYPLTSSISFEISDNDNNFY